MIKFKMKLIHIQIILLFFIFGFSTNASSSNFLLKSELIDVIAPQGLGQSDIYQKILEEMNSQYQQIGLREAKKVLGNRDFSLSGGLNSIGFSYQRPFIDFSLSVDRNLAPDLFDDKRWIVTDTCTLFIDASKLLSNLKNQKIIDISEINLAAFAGIVYKRTFTWVHYAANYEEGLTTHFEKLFFPFASMNVFNISHLEKNEMVFKEDSISIKAGGLVSAPLYPGIFAKAGALAKFEKISRIEVISFPHLTDEGSDIHFSSEKSSTSSAAFNVGIQAEFLKILKLTLLSYDFSFELSQSYKIYLNLSQLDLLEMNAGSPIAKEVKNILTNKDANLLILSPFLISEEKKLAQAISHKYNFFLLGGTKVAKTQQIQITSDGKVKNFFRHYFEKIKYTEDVASKIFASVIYAITNTDPSVASLASDTNRVTLEYDSEKNLLDIKENLLLGKTEQMLSLTFSAEYMTKKSSGFFGKKYRDKAIYLLERFSAVDPLVIKMVENDELKAPYHISGRYQVNAEGISYLNALSLTNVFDQIGSICDEYPKTGFVNFRNLFDHCKNSLQNDYFNYRIDLTHDKITSQNIKDCESKSFRFFFSSAKKRAFIKNCLSEVSRKDPDKFQAIPLWSLKNFANNLSSNVSSKVHYYNLFGISNVFFFGNFTALTSNNFNFDISFHEGDFKGLGVVDGYMRNENLRAPSSVVIDQ